MGNSNQPSNKPKRKSLSRKRSKSDPPSKMDSMTRTPSMQTRSMPRTPSLYPQMSARVSKTHMAQFLNLDVNNGVTGTFVSTRICAMIHSFWTNHVSVLSQSQKLVVANTIFFGMIATSKSVKTIIFKICNTDIKHMQQLSVKFLDMMGWIVRSLMKDGIDLYGSLKKIGQLHQDQGITFLHFEPMLKSMHETFEEYFEKGYSFPVRYAMDEVFFLISHIMMGRLPDQRNSNLTEIHKMLNGNKVEILQSLHVCLSSTVGREYFMRYLKHTWCDEIAIWLKSLFLFKTATNDKQRFFIAREITKVSIHSKSSFAINISYSAREGALAGMKVLEQRFAAKEDLNIDSDYFFKIEREMMELIRKNHWVGFVNKVKELKAECTSGTLANPDLHDI